MTPPTAATPSPSTATGAPPRTADAGERGGKAPPKPSFTRGVFLGELREELIFPYPTLSEAESESLRMAIDSFRDFAAANVDMHKHDRDGRFDPKVLAGMHELGLMGVVIPEEYGGFGASAK